MKSRSVVLYISIFFIAVIFSNTLHAQNDTTSNGGKRFIFLVAPAGETSVGQKVQEAWFSVISESYYTFRLNSLNKVSVIPRSTWTKEGDMDTRYGFDVGQDRLIALAKRYGATHILTHTYEVKIPSVHYLLDIYSMDSRSVIMSSEISFSIDQVETTLDSCILALVTKLQIPVNATVKELLRRPLLTTNPKNLRAFTTILEESNGVVDKKNINKITAIVDKDPVFVLAVYAAAQYAAQQEDCSGAGQYYNHLIMRNGFPLTQFYVQAIQANIKCQNFDKALRLFDLTEKNNMMNSDLLAQKATILVRLDRKEEARNSFEEILKKDPNQLDALLFLAKQYREEKAYQKSLECLNRLVKSSAASGEIFLEQGLTLIALKNYPEALKALQSASRLLPKDPRPLVYLGDLYYDKKDYRSAIESYSSVLELNDAQVTPEIVLKLSRSYLSTNSASTAAIMLQKYQSRFSDNKYIARELGVLKFKDRDTIGSRSLLEQCVSLQPPDSMVFLILGDIYASAQDYDRAASMYEKAEPIIQNKNAVALSIARLSILTKKFDKAEVALKGVLGRSPQYPLANQYFGDVMQAKGSNKEALSRYLAERKAHGDSKYLQQQISELSFKTGDMVTARKESERLIITDPNNGKAYLQLAIISLKSRNAPEANKYLQKAEKLGSSDPSLYKEIAQGLVAKGMRDQAIAAYERYLQTKPDATLLLELAKLYTQTRQDTMTAVTYLKLVELNPQKYQGYLAQAGTIYFNAGKKKQAYDIYNRYSEKGPFDQTVASNLASMEFDKKDYAKTAALLKKVNRPAVEKNKDLLRMLAFSLYYTEQYREALPLLKKIYPVTREVAEFTALSAEKCNALADATMAYKKYLSLGKTEKSPDYGYRLGQLYEKQKLTQPAIAQYAANTIAAPLEYRNYDRLIALYMGQKLYLQASEAIRKAQRLPDAPSDLARMLAEIYLAQNKKQLAAPAYEKYLEKAPRDSLALLKLANIYYGSGEYAKSIKPLEGCMALMPDNPDVLKKLVDAYTKTGNIQKSIEPIAALLAKDPNNIILLQNLMASYERTRDTTALIKTMQKYLSLQPTDFKTTSYLGALLLKKSDTAHALEYMEAASKLKPADISLHLQLIQLYDNSPEKRMNHLSLAIKLQPRNPELYYQQARSYEAIKMADKARFAYKQALIIKPTHKQAISGYGTLLMAGREYRDAFGLFASAVRIEPRNKEYLLNYVVSAYYLGNKQITLKGIEQLLSIDAKDAQVLKWCGAVYASYGYQAKAEQLLIKSVELNDKCAECFEQLGYINLNRNGYENALSYLETALSLYNDDKPRDTLIFSLGTAYYALNKTKEAVKLYEKAFKLNPKNQELIYRLCVAYIDLNKLDDAESVVRNNSSDNNKTGWLHLAKARVQEARGNNSEAFTAYFTAQRQMPNNIDCYKGIGRVYLRQNDYNNAIEYFSRALALSESDPTILLGLTEAYYRMSNFSAASEMLSEVQKKLKENPDVYRLSGMIALYQKKYNQAVAQLTKAAALDEKNAEIYFGLGIAYANILQFEDAVNTLLKSLKYDEKREKDICKYVGDIYYNFIKDNKNALKYYTRYIKAGGNSPEVIELVKTL